MSWTNELKKIAHGRILEDEPMSRHTTFRVGGPCSLFISPRDEEDLVVIMKFLRADNVPHLVIGQGSNLLFADAGFRGCVVSIGSGMRGIDVGEEETVVKAGTLLHRLVGEMVGSGMAGMEALAGIPGTVGGAIYMNAGAFNQTISDILKWVEFLDDTGTVRRLEKENLLFRYRWSLFRNLPKWVILGACFKPDHAPAEALKEKMKELGNKRKDTQPWDFPSAGSFFKNPEGRSAGALIDQAGLKGFAVGGAAVSEIHANFIVNNGGATCDDILKLMKHIQARVQKIHRVDLEPEVRIIPESISKVFA